MTANQPRFAPYYPLDAFHHVAREAGLELRRNVQVPDAMIGMGLINAISMTCQGLIDVKLPTGQTRPVTQNLMLVAESGERKSTVFELLQAPFRDADMKAMTAFKLQAESYEVELGLWTAKVKGLKGAISKAVASGMSSEALEAQLKEYAGKKPLQPRLRCFLRQDITAKAIMEALQGDGESIAITTDEGHMLFKSEAMANVGLLNRLWDSPGMMPLDRAENEHLIAMNPRVSVSIMTQYEPLKQFLNRRGSVAKGSGHWARYLVAWPRSMMGYRRIEDVEPVWEHLPAFHERIAELLSKYKELSATGAIAREVVSFTLDARARWVALAAETESMLRDGEYLSDINDFAAKIMEIVARLAASMQYFSGEGGDITLDTINRAFDIVRWHVEEYKYLFSPDFVMAQDQVDARALDSYLFTRWWQGRNSDTYVPKNQVLRCGPVRDRARLNAALAILKIQGAIQIGPGYRDKRTYLRLMNYYFERRAL
ncbi:YfjI family protein [Stenotrophomonas sp. JC08]|uniref:YfjI family protein n=1 Tax=Stenotrophomonas sp. JC08 TaxID=3445779 RepID=UPI003FA32588